MAWNPDHKQQTRQKILDSAAYLFAQKGFEHVGINDVMKHAGLTRGAFYSHFESKSDLYAESILSAAKRISKRIDPAASNALDFDHLISAYLSKEHADGRSYNCPLAFLTTDITQRDDQVREAYTRVFKGFVRFMELRLDPDSQTESSEQSLQNAVMMIGGIALARAIKDQELSSELISACAKGIQQPETQDS